MFVCMLGDFFAFFSPCGSLFSRKANPSWGGDVHRRPWKEFGKTR